MQEGERTSVYKAVDYKHWEGVAVQDVSKALKDKTDWTVFRLFTSFSDLGDGLKLLNTIVPFDAVVSARSGRETAPAFEWKGFQDWLIGRIGTISVQKRQDILGAMNNSENMTTMLRAVLPNLGGNKSVPAGYEFAKINPRVQMIKAAREHKLFYNITDGNSGRFRLRFEQKFVDALYEASPEFKRLRDELHSRGFKPGKVGPNREKFEFWSLMFVLPGAEDQKGQETDGAALKPCVAHADNGGSKLYYVSNIVPLTVDPPEAGGTVMVKSRCQAFAGTGTRDIEDPLNTYGYVLSFRGGVWHFGSKNNTKNHVRVFIMQVLTEQREDPNDVRQDPANDK
jgi:hypothetical protein